MLTLIKNIGCMATNTGCAAKSGIEQGEIKTLNNAWILCNDGVIADIGSGECTVKANEVIDAGGKLVTAGLVDSHTHLVFGGWRENELALKLHGVEYLDILRQGGGILSTVKATRSAAEDELCEKTRSALTDMLSLGTTTCEAKSGYGLDFETEIKQLKVVKRLNNEQPIELVSTFMAAHAVPEEYKGDKAGYVEEVTEHMLPEVAKEGLAEYCDVFCETAVFDADDSRRILKKAQDLGLGAKIHADEIDTIGGSELAGEIKAVSAEHLISCRDSGIESMARGGTIAVLLPCTSFYLDKGLAPAKKMIEKGVPVAVATDFNPGSTPNLSIQLAMNIACYKYRMTPEEVLTAVTLNAAAAIGRADKIGTIETGKQADLVIWNADNLNMIFYRYGSNQVKTVIKKGKIVKEN